MAGDFCAISPIMKCRLSSRLHQWIVKFATHTCGFVLAGKRSPLSLILEQRVSIIHSPSVAVKVKLDDVCIIKFVDIAGSVQLAKLSSFGTSSIISNIFIIIKFRLSNVLELTSQPTGDFQL